MPLPQPMLSFTQVIGSTLDVAGVGLNRTGTDATTTDSKFLISDHPVTLYNRELFPDSPFCRRATDPDFRMNGTHTLFPLSPTRILILTHLSWVRNPYGKGEKLRPNPSMFRPAMFNFTGIHVGRELDETEVNQINFIIKRRAHRYVAATREEWLYPEEKIPSTHWRKLDDRYLLMPDPRSEVLGGAMAIGYKDGSAEAFDEYGRRPWQQGYSGGSEPSEELSAHSRTLYGFQGDFGRLVTREPWTEIAPSEVPECGLKKSSLFTNRLDPYVDGPLLARGRAAF